MGFDPWFLALWNVWKIQMPGLQSSSLRSECLDGRALALAYFKIIWVYVNGQPALRPADLDPEADSSFPIGASRTEGREQAKGAFQHECDPLANLNGFRSHWNRLSSYGGNGIENLHQVESGLETHHCTESSKDKDSFLQVQSVTVKLLHISDAVTVPGT